MDKLTKEEKEILRSFQAGEWRNVPNMKKEIERYRRYAKATLKKDRRVNIRLSGADLLGIQREAVKEGIPYQTLMTSVLHKYVTGTLVHAHR